VSGGRVAFVTGAGSGIGRACAGELALRGYRIVVTDRTLDGARSTAVELDSAHAVELDVRDEAAVARAVEAALGWAGQIDVLVNNAGINSPYTVLDTPVELWDDVFAVNIRGMFLCSKAVLPHMIERGGGAIVNMASASSLVGMAERAAYGASKGAVLSFTRCLALDHVRQGIRVNCVCPGSIDTPWVERLVQASDDPEATLTEIVERQPMERLGTAEEIAKAVAYLASDDAAYVTGTALVVDGGWTTR
jgi:meso-butanediol dehydrogenase / (S,S)-butanediol dehydrogenase / diacetyl reductase